LGKPMTSSFYEALKSAGVSDQKAREAATDVANYDDRITRIERTIGLLRWMVGFNIALTVAVLLRTFF
jgi:hypothetical protein